MHAILSAFHIKLRGLLYIGSKKVYNEGFTPS